MNLPDSEVKRGKKPPRGGNGRGNTLPDAEGGDFGEWFNVNHITDGLTKVVFLGDVKLDQQPKFGARVIAQVKYGKETFAWGIKIDSANYRKLLKKFGKNAGNWKGPVKIQVSEYNGNDYIAIV